MPSSKICSLSKLSAETRLFGWTCGRCWEIFDFNQYVSWTGAFLIRGAQKCLILAVQGQLNRRPCHYMCVRVSESLTKMAMISGSQLSQSVIQGFSLSKYLWLSLSLSFRDLWHLRHWLQFMTIFVTWQLRGTLGSIRNSCNVLALQFSVVLAAMCQL